jgi:hypothetical protein
MGRFLIFVILAVAVGLVMTNRVSLDSLDPRSVGTQMEGLRVVRSADQIEGRFTRLGLVEETYMLFGGDAQQRHNQLSHATLTGLSMGYARSIAQRHPDFHLCKSRGAPEAQRLAEHMSLVAADRSARATLTRAIDLFEERLSAGGERTCLRIRGSELSLDSVSVPEEGIDLSDEALPAFSKTRFVLAEEASLEECAPLLR